VREVLGCIEAIDLAGATAQRHDGDPGVARVVLDAVRYRLAKIGEAVGTAIASTGTAAANLFTQLKTACGS